MFNRCSWCENTQKMIRYHDEEWGTPLHDDHKLFEHLTLEVMQCGLNWNMMIEKREIFRACFANFDYNLIAEFDDVDVERILATKGMIKNHKKICAVIANARAFQEIVAAYGSFDRYLWGFTDGKTMCYESHKSGDLPAKNALSECISKDLKRRGFTFTGPVVMYSHLQACGLINDHVESCFRYREIIEHYPTVRLARDTETMQLIHYSPIRHSPCV